MTEPRSPDDHTADDHSADDHRDIDPEFVELAADLERQLHEQAAAIGARPPAVTVVTAQSRQRQVRHQRHLVSVAAAAAVLVVVLTGTAVIRGADHERQVDLQPVGAGGGSSVAPVTAPAAATLPLRLSFDPDYATPLQLPSSPCCSEAYGPPDGLSADQVALTGLTPGPASPIGSGTWIIGPLLSQPRVVTFSSTGSLIDSRIQITVDAAPLPLTVAGDTRPEPVQNGSLVTVQRVIDANHLAVIHTIGFASSDTLSIASGLKLDADGWPVIAVPPADTREIRTSNPGPTVNRSSGTYTSNTNQTFTLSVESADRPSAGFFEGETGQLLDTTGSGSSLNPVSFKAVRVRGHDGIARIDDAGATAHIRVMWEEPDHNAVAKLDIEGANAVDGLDDILTHIISIDEQTWQRLARNCPLPSTTVSPTVVPAPPNPATATGAPPC